MRIILLSLVIMPVITFAQNIPLINIVPRPAQVNRVEGANFIITKNTVIVCEASGLQNIAAILNDYLEKVYGIKLKISKKEIGKDTILLNYQKNDKPTQGAYSLNINNKLVYIAGDDAPGVFYGMETLLQLLPSNNKILQPGFDGTQNLCLQVPALVIKDYPRFAYRGMHLDAGRHFFRPESVKRYIDYLARHKFNYFHWHLTDDQGWRIEIKKYPLLTSSGGFRNGTIVGKKPGNSNDSLHYGGYYTQQQIKDIVKYAVARYITIIPEIEMPGHASAAIAAYPQLSCFPAESTKILSTTPWAGSREGKQVQQTWGVFEDVFCPSEYTFNFLENVLDEVLALFPSTYIHIGGDECPKQSWKRSAFCQQLIKNNNLKDEHGLQSYFIGRIEKYLNSKGRKIIGWDEILEGGIAPNATIMSWRGEDGGIAAAKQHHNVIMTPNTYVYFDYSQSKNEDSLTIGGYLPLEKVYNYEPLPAALDTSEAKYIIGVQANVWTEYIPDDKKLEYLVFPRMSALSEVAWSQRSLKDWNDFERRLPAILERYKLWGANYSNAYFDLHASVLPAEGYKGVLWKLETKSNQIITVKYNESDSTRTYINPLLISESTKAYASVNSNGKSISQQFFINKATGKKITLKDQPAEKYPGSGAFTLVNGVITEKKLEQASEWLGFLGKDLEAVIDLGKQDSINSITLDVLKQEGSQVYLPASVEFFTSANGTDFILRGMLQPGSNHTWPDERKIALKLNNISARYVKITAKNYGIIPPGLPFAGNPSWLFADEIEVK